MIRIFLILLLIVAAAAGTIYLNTLPGGISFDLFGFEGRFNLAATVVAIMALGGLAALVWGVLAGLIRLPGKLGKSRHASKVKKANMALTDGLLAAEAGDVEAVSYTHLTLPTKA